MNVLISDAVADSTVEALNAKPNLTVNYQPGVNGGIFYSPPTRS